MARHEAPHLHRPDMPAAMKMVREALGDEAIILSTSRIKGKKRRHQRHRGMEGRNPPL